MPTGTNVVPLAVVVSSPREGAEPLEVTVIWRAKLRFSFTESSHEPRQDVEPPIFDRLFLCRCPGCRRNYHERARSGIKNIVTVARDEICLCDGGIYYSIEWGCPCRSCRHRMEAYTRQPRLECIPKVRFDTKRAVLPRHEWSKWFGWRSTLGGAPDLSEGEPLTIRGNLSAHALKRRKTHHIYLRLPNPQG